MKYYISSSSYMRQAYVMTFETQLDECAQYSWMEGIQNHPIGTGRVHIFLKKVHNRNVLSDTLMKYAF